MSAHVITTQAQYHLERSVAPLVLQMPRELSTREAVVALLEEMKACRSCSLAVAEWANDNFLQYFDDISSEEKQEIAATALCLLLQDCVDPSIATEEDLDQLDLLGAFESKIKNLIASLRPEGTCIETFIKETIQKDKRPQLSVEEQCRIIDGLFRQEMQQLCSAANAISRNIVDRFNALKQQLQEISRNRQSMRSEIRAVLDLLTAKIQENSLIITAQTEEIDALGERMKREEIIFSGLLAQCEEILRRKE